MPPADRPTTPAPSVASDDLIELAGGSRLSLLAGAGTLLAVGLLVLAMPDLREAAGLALQGDGGELRTHLRDLDAVGVLVLILLMLVHAVVLFPSEIVTAAAGFVYGFLGALPIVVGGWLASALLTYWIGRHAGRPVLRRLAGGHRLERAEAAVQRGGVPVLLAARLIPIVPYSLVGYVAGATRVSVWTFSWTTVVGSLPLSLMVILLGSRLESLSLTDPIVWAAIAPILIATFIGHRMVRRTSS